MYAPAQLHPEDNFAKYIRWSAIGHVVVLALFIMRTVFYPSEPILIQHAIRVDMVGLPTKTQAATILPSEPKAKAAPKPAEPKPLPVTKKVLPDVKKLDPKKVDLRKSSTAEDDAIKRLEAFKKLAEMSKAKSQPKAAAEPIRGAALSPGSSLVGLNKIDYDDYLDKLNEKVKANWNLPSLLKNRELTATVMVYINSSGNIAKKEIKKSSGNSVFDEKCLEAIDLSGPFESPPSKLTNILAVDGVEFGFPE